MVNSGYWFRSGLPRHPKHGLADAGNHRRWVTGPYLAESFIEMIDEWTTAVVISSVASHNGARPALVAVREACTAVGATLVVDGTQSAGIIPPDVPVADLDLFVCAGYKGLRGPRGAAYAF